MLSNFQAYFAKNFPYLQGKKLLLAVSGGIDSMVMADLFLKNKADFAIAHCNFQLRANESNGDEIFLKNHSEANQIPFFSIKFDTKAFAKDFRLSTQMAARELRYKWFDELLQKEPYDYVLTAHHADDNLETFLINLSRGTGIEGLTGIPKQTDQIVRPLLDFSRAEIERYASENQLQWREDSSNASDKYLRNKIRHSIVPVLKEINPELLSSFQKTQHYLQQTQTMAEDASVLVFQQVAQKADDEIHFNIQKLQQLPNYKSYLYQWLRGYGFTAWNDIYELTQSQTGKQIFSPQFRLLKNRHFLILSPLTETTASQNFFIARDQKEVNFPINLSISAVNAISNAANNTIFVDAEKLVFPLELRKWNEGDVFVPFGMNGRSKKVSKFFKDEKISVIEKEKTWLLCSADQIIWIAGIRADERFKVTNTTKQIFKIVLTQ